MPDNDEFFHYDCLVEEIPGPRDTVKRKRRDLAPFPRKVRALASTPRPGVDRGAVTNY